mmetsp:Transcript_3225/g.11677  ORF Transcript_3225/g.11677 Transcript_3225/m.11677 type:complete len:368 (-) Transcript_3225:655-1758(-)|eukprot:scaffold1261_cov377-Prasinococcus_capsulatus_cf.AAC.12
MGQTASVPPSPGRADGGARRSAASSRALAILRQRTSQDRHTMPRSRSHPARTRAERRAEKLARQQGRAPSAPDRGRTVARAINRGSRRGRQTMRSARSGAHLPAAASMSGPGRRLRMELRQRRRRFLDFGERWQQLLMLLGLHVAALLHRLEDLRLQLAVAGRGQLAMEAPEIDFLHGIAQGARAQVLHGEDTGGDEAVLVLGRGALEAQQQQRGREHQPRAPLSAVAVRHDAQAAAQRRDDAHDEALEVRQARGGHELVADRVVDRLEAHLCGLLQQVRHPRTRHLVALQQHHQHPRAVHLPNHLEIHLEVARPVVPPLALGAPRSHADAHGRLEGILLRADVPVGAHRGRARQHRLPASFRRPRR